MTGKLTLSILVFWHFIGRDSLYIKNKRSNIKMTIQNDKILNFALLSLILIFTFLFFLHPVHGSEIFFDTPAKKIGIGDQFELGVFIESQVETINAIESRIIFPADYFDVKEIRDGGSLLPLWVERPHLISPEVIFFSGVVPGGYIGPRGYLFSLLVEAKKSGFVTFQTDNELILLHDGDE